MTESDKAKPNLTTKSLSRAGIAGDLVAGSSFPEAT
jgi:hypothetical protein